MNHLYGVYTAVVTDNVDPNNLGRVKIALPRLGHTVNPQHGEWARIATLMAGKHYGSWFIPEVGDEVLVAFDAGDFRQPYVLGSLWSNANPPPLASDAHNNKQQLCSRDGLKITLDDEPGAANIRIETPAGQKLVLKDNPAAIEISDNNGNTITLGSNGISITASTKVMLHASLVEIDSGVVTVNSGMTKFSGVVQCDTLISNSVISASYSPGAGNIV